jgi:hypothetical protein
MPHPAQDSRSLRSPRLLIRHITPGCRRETWMKTFDDFVAKASPANPVLPLIHMTDGFCMRLILEQKELAPQDCPTLGQPALYFSYGRPSFRPNGGAQPTALISYAPVCFVVDATKVPIKKAFPFDSGAFDRKMFASSTHRKMKLSHFELAADLSRPRQVVTTFFGTNGNYFDNNPKKDLAFHAFTACVRQVRETPQQLE